MENAQLKFTHAGARFVFGHGDDFYGIWDRLTPGSPVQRFPQNESGRQQAWLAFQALEPNAANTPAAQLGVQARNNGLAVASLVLGVVGFLYLVPAILALIFGYVSKQQIDASRGTQTGRGMAIAGIALGWVWIGITTLWVIAAAASA